MSNLVHKYFCIVGGASSEFLEVGLLAQRVNGYKVLLNSATFPSVRVSCTIFHCHQQRMSACFPTLNNRIFHQSFGYFCQSSG